VFFFFISSSGKSCALSAILKTINTNYGIQTPVDRVKKVFGLVYREDLVNKVFLHDNIGYLPTATAEQRTQYMPFLLKKNGVKEPYRNISFFELSGEIFKCFHKIIHKNISPDSISSDEDNFNANEREAFETLKLLLNSKNQKIHFFFINYNQKPDEQTKYLNAAATYFQKYNDIFKKRTDAVYVVVAQADKIEAKDDKERSDLAGEFLKKYFNAFIDVVRTSCANHSVFFRGKIFSIGDVYFKQICKINQKYSEDIIEDLLIMVKPSLSVKNPVIGWFFKFFNK
jgi:hypothetical protein